MESTISPVGILSNIYRLPLNIRERFAIMDAVGRLATEDRLELESTALHQGARLGAALEEVLSAQAAIRTGDEDALWERLLLAIMREKIAEGSEDRTQVFKIRPETPLEHRKHKDEQKARMLQSLGRGGSMPDKNVWRAVTLVVDRGHKTVDIEAIVGESAEDITQKESWLAEAYQYLIRDQSHIMNDLLGIVEEELAAPQGSGTLHEFFKNIGVEGDDFIAMLRDLESGISHEITRHSEAISGRVQQYHMLKAIHRHDGNARFAHLAHAFFESLRVLFDGMGALGIIAAERDLREKEVLFERAKVAQLPAMQKSNYPAEIIALQELYRGVDELTTLFDTADGAVRAGALDYDRWDSLQASVTEACGALAEDLATERKAPLNEFAEKINVIFKHAAERLNNEAPDEQGSNHLLSRLVSIGDAYRDAVSAAAIRKGKGFTVAAADVRQLADARAEATDEWRERIRVTAQQTDGLLGQVLEREDFARFDQDLVGVLEAIMETAGMALSMEDGWEDEMGEYLAAWREISRTVKKMPQEIADAVSPLDRAYRMKPLGRIFEEADERWGSDYPFVAFPLKERKEKFRQLVSVYNLLRNSLLRKRVTLSLEELAKESVERVRDLVNGMEALMGKLLKLDQRIQEYEKLESILENQENIMVLKDLTRSVFLGYSQKNFKNFKIALKNGDLDASQAAALAGAMVQSTEMEKGLASSFIGALNPEQFATV